MFKVQRFTADDEEEASGGHDSTSILDSILKRAKSRAWSNSKRARLEPTISTGGGGGGGIHEDSPVNPGASRSAKARAAGDTVSGIVAAGRSAAPSVAEAKHGGVRLLERDSLTSDSVEAVEDATGSEGGESEESDESDQSEESEEEDEEGMDIDGEDEDEDDEEEGEEDEEAGAGLEGATQQVPDAGADGTGDVGGEGLRPMEEVADEWGLDARLAEALREEGVKHFFPIQVLLVRYHTTEVVLVSYVVRIAVVSLHGDVVPGTKVPGTWYDRYMHTRYAPG